MRVFRPIRPVNSLPLVAVGDRGGLALSSETLLTFRRPPCGWQMVVPVDLDSRLHCRPLAGWIIGSHGLLKSPFGRSRSVAQAALPIRTESRMLLWLPHGVQGAFGCTLQPRRHMDSRAPIGAFCSTTSRNVWYREGLVGLGDLKDRVAVIGIRDSFGDVPVGCGRESRAKSQSRNLTAGVAWQERAWASAADRIPCLVDGHGTGPSTDPFSS